MNIKKIRWQCGFRMTLQLTCIVFGFGSCTAETETAQIMTIMMLDNDENHTPLQGRRHTVVLSARHLRSARRASWPAAVHESPPRNVLQPGRLCVGHGEPGAGATPSHRDLGLSDRMTRRQGRCCWVISPTGVVSGGASARSSSVLSTWRYCSVVVSRFRLIGRTRGAFRLLRAAGPLYWLCSPLPGGVLLTPASVLCWGVVPWIRGPSICQFQFSFPSTPTPLPLQRNEKFDWARTCSRCGPLVEKTSSPSSSRKKERHKAEKHIWTENLVKDPGINFGNGYKLTTSALEPIFRQRT